MKRFRYLVLTFLLFLFVTFFSVTKDVEAANFKYSDFSWEELASNNKKFWTAICDEDDQDCIDSILDTKKEFYTRLYELLAMYQDKGFYIDDNIVIATVFYDLTATTFRDPVDNSYNPYIIDEGSTKNDFIGGDDGNRDSAKEYFKNETDSLKTLLNNFIGFKTQCYGLADEPPVVDSETGAKSCPDGLFLYGDKCAEEVNNYKGTFFDSLGLSFFGFFKFLSVKTNSNEQKCEEESKEKGYSSYDIKTNKTQEVNEEYFYEFLKTSKYFDSKDHLQSYFYDVLHNTGAKNMNEFYEMAEQDNSLIEKYEDIITAARERIITNIKSILTSHGEFSEVSKNYSATCNSNTTYFWPIGSSETEESDGKILATGNPVSTTISSRFGLRDNPTDSSGTEKENHKGVDIGATNGTNVIAAGNGTVIKGAEGDSGTCTEGDTSCGGGYGNFIIIQHTDGNYTLYAHMETGSVTVKDGDTVTQGQVIGHVGSTGKSTGNHLHFEVRIGSNDSNSVQDPLNYISPTSPRSSSTCNNGNMSELAEFIGYLEGGKTDKDGNYVVINIGDGVRTFGHGIVVEYNKEVISKHGYNPSSLTLGTKVDKVSADAMYEDIVRNHMESVKTKLSQSGISGLNDNQLGALTSLEFNCGNIKGFVDAYKKYGSTDSLCTNWWHNKALHDANGKYYPGLAKRRKAECDLFLNGNYNMNAYG